MLRTFGARTGGCHGTVMKPIRLIHFTDTHLTGDPAAIIRGVASLPALRAVIDDAHHRCEHPDGILLTGDLVQDDPAGYPLIRRLFGGSNVPVLCLAGNHDLPDQMRSELNRAPFQVGGKAQFGGWLVVLLDTWVANAAEGRVGDTQLSWLRETLQAHRDHHVLVCLHHQPIRMQSEWLDRYGLQDDQEFVEIVSANPNVRGVLWGHVHQSLDSFVAGTRFMATPATCAQFLPHSREFAFDDRPPGYRLLDLQPDGSITTEVIWLERDAQRVVA